MTWCKPPLKSFASDTSHAIRFFVAVLIVFVFVPALEAKTSTVSGIIFTLGSDKVQTVWPNARVTLKNVDTGSEAATVSNDLGTYAFTGVLYGHYVRSTRSRWLDLNRLLKR